MQWLVDIGVSCIQSDDSISGQTRGVTRAGSPLMTQNVHHTVTTKDVLSASTAGVYPLYLCARNCSFIWEYPLYFVHACVFVHVCILCSPVYARVCRYVCILCTFFHLCVSSVHLCMIVNFRMQE